MAKSEIEFARILFSQKKYNDAKNIFINNDLLYEAGFCTLLSGSMENAGLIWKEIKSPCIATDWGIIVLDLLKFKAAKSPGYFQVRAFLEIYLNLFIENEHIEWAENLISSYKFLTKSNQEVPKFIARALFSNGYFKLVHQFADIAKSLCYYDPEIHFIEAQTYFFEKDSKKANICIEETLKVAPGYYPAHKLKGVIVQ